MSFHDIPSSISSRHKHVAVMFGVQHPRIGQGTWPVRGGVVVGRHTAARNFPRDRGKRKLVHGHPGMGAGPPTQPPPGAPWIARTRERRCVPGRGRGEGAVGHQECQESVRRFARDVGVRRPKGVGLGVAEPHEVGADTRKDDRKIDCLKAGGTSATAYKARESGGSGTVGNSVGQTDLIPTGPGRPSMLVLHN